MGMATLGATEDPGVALFERVQGLYRACLFQPVDSGTLDGLRGLEAELAGRFAAEDAMMDRSRFPDAAAHRAAHEAILRALAVLMRAVEQQQAGAFRHGMPDLAFIILDHTLRDDRRLGDHLRHRCGASASPVGLARH